MNVTESTAHPVAPEEVMAFLDGEVSAERAQFLAEHLKSCGECQRVSEDLTGVRRSMAAWQVAPLPSKRIDRVLIEAKETKGAVSSPRNFPWFRKRWTWKRWTLALGFSAMSLLLILSMSRLRPKMADSEAYEVARGHSGASQPKIVKNIREVDGISVDNARVNKPESQAEGVTGGVPGGLSRFGRAEASVPVPMIARSAELTIVVSDFEGARGKMEAILARHHGYAANLTTSNEPGSPRALTASLRIPAGELGVALAEFKALGRVQYESQKGEEVTQQHADLVARLNNARETEKRMQAILKQRTGKISDVLAVEQEIARVRGEIEQMEAEQKTLEHRVDFAAVELKLAEEYKAQLDGATPSISRRLRNALVTGYKDAIESLVSLCLFVAEYGPILLLWVAILLLPTRWVWRRWRRAAAV